MQDGIPLPRRYGAIAAIALGVSLSVLDGTIANVALPTIAGDLRISPASSIWVVNAYQLAIVVSLLALSSLGDLIGYRKIYLGGLIVFTLASLGCVLSRSLAELTVARTVQGFGAAAVSSVNTALIRVIYPRRYLGRGMGINALVVAVSAAVRAHRGRRRAVGRSVAMAFRRQSAARPAGHLAGPALSSAQSGRGART